MKDKFNLHGQQSGRGSLEDLASDICCAASIFFSEVVRIYEQGNKAIIS